MREKEVEAYLVKRMKEIGGVAYKFTSPARRGVPDRLCLFPNQRMMFVELKRPGGSTTKLQDYEHERITYLGQRVDVIDSKEKVDLLIQESQTWN
jgi:hypothetical protein